MTHLQPSEFHPIADIRPISAVLLAPVTSSVDLAGLGEGLAELLGDLNLAVTRAELLSAGVLRLITPRCEVLLTSCPAPLPRERTARANRPADAEAGDQRALTLLARHRSTLALSLRAPESGDLIDSGVLSHQQGLALCRRLMRHLAGQWPAELVFWEDTGTLYLLEEYQALGGRARIVPLHPRQADLPPVEPRQRRPATPDYGAEPSTLSETLARLDKVLPKRPQSVQSRPKQPASPAQAQANSGVANALPHLPRAGHHIHSRLRAALSQLHLPGDNALCTAKETSLPARLAVYALNGSILVMAFPVGMSMLIYNVIRGEDMVATARMMALTGIGMAVMAYTKLGAILPFV